MRFTVTRSAFALTALAAVLAILSACSGGFVGQVEQITIGVPPNEEAGLVFIAQDQRLFDKTGLNATIKQYDTALAAVDGMKKGEVDVALSAEFPIVRQAFAKENIAVIASIDKFQNTQLVARTDAGIEKVQDLKGKKVGVPQGTIMEFFLGKFLDLHGVSRRDVTFVNLPLAKAATALADGTVDAFQVQSKELAAIRARLGDKMVVWPSQGEQSGFEVVSGRQDWVNRHQQAVDRLLRALLEAERFYARNEEQARGIIQKSLNYDEAYMAAIRGQHQYALTLDQSLILAMQDQARWMIANNLTAEKQVPGFLSYIFAGGLKAIKPEAVNIIQSSPK